MTQGDMLDELGALPHSELGAAIDGCDPQALADVLARRFAARLDAKRMAKSGIVIQEIFHTTDDVVSTYITWTKSGFEVTPTFDGTRRPARIEWQRLSDAVNYELDRITLQGVALVERVTMVGTSEEIDTIFDAENVGSRRGHVIRSVFSSRNEPEKSVRSRCEASTSPGFSWSSSRR